MSDLHDIAQQLVAANKGILAADESNNTAGKRLASINMESTPENRLAYRELFLGTEGIENYLSGVILYDETIRQTLSNGKTVPEHLQGLGIVPGIKVDMGLQDLPNYPNEKYTQGIDGLRARLKEYYDMGARFTKWRSLIVIGEDTPTVAAIHTSCHGMALYAALVQEAGMVPIVEPEVLLDGTHDINKSNEVTTKTLKTLFELMGYYKVDMKGAILKTSMVISGKDCAEQADAKTVGEMTIKCLSESIPADLGGVVFLSGGQTAEQATDNLNAVNVAGKTANAPWQLTFSYARALQGPSLALWAGDEANIPTAREKFLERLKANSAARMGTYGADRAHNGVGAQEEMIGVSQD
jgi:fructose-bisphosphate aldolase class I